MKRFLGYICLLYSLIIGYVWITGNINNYLASNMQIYIKISLIPLIIMGIILLIDKDIKYKFKISDLVLILPLIMLLLNGNGILTSTFASNRSSVKREKNKIQSNINSNSNKIEKEKYDFTHPDFDIDEPVYDMLANYITYEEGGKKFEGKTIRVKGFAVSSIEYIPKGFFALCKYSISCCAADANFVGFMVKYDGIVKNDDWYEVEGVLRPGTDKDGYSMMYIDVVNIKKIKKENQYVYPCYSYGDGTCSALSKYDL